MTITDLNPVWLSIAMAIGWILLHRHLPKLFGVRIPIRFEDWEHELERAASDVVRADLCAAQAKKRLVELIGQIPEEFDPTVWLGLKVADGVQRAVLIKAAEEGIIQPDVVRRLYPGVLPEPSVKETDPLTNLMQKADADQHVLMQSADRFTQNAERSNLHFLGGRLRPRTRDGR